MSNVFEDHVNSLPSNVTSVRPSSWYGRKLRKLAEDRAMAGNPSCWADIKQDEMNTPEGRAIRQEIADRQAELIYDAGLGPVGKVRKVGLFRRFVNSL